MSFMPWKDDYSVGVTLFDEQHQKMFGYINDLGDAINEVEEHAVLREIIDGLISYTLTHFNDEEVNLRRYEFPDYDKHKAEHDLLTLKVKAFAYDFSVDAVESADIMKFLQTWILDHILETDMAYSDLLADKEIS